MPDYDLMDLRKWTQNIEKLRGIKGDGLEDELLSDALISGEKSRGIETLPRLDGSTLSYLRVLFACSEGPDMVHSRWSAEGDFYNGAVVQWK